MITCTGKDRKTCNVEKMGCEGCAYKVSKEVEDTIYKIIDKGITNYQTLERGFVNKYNDKSSKSKERREEIFKEIDLYIKAYKTMKIILKKENNGYDKNTTRI